MESFSASKTNFRYEFRCSCPWHQEPQEGGGKPLVCGYVKDARQPRRVAIIKRQKKGGTAFVISVNTQGCNTTGPFSILKPLFPQIDSLLMVAEPQQVYSNVIRLLLKKTQASLMTNEKCQEAVNALHQIAGCSLDQPKNMKQKTTLEWLQQRKVKITSDHGPAKDLTKVCCLCSMHGTRWLVHTAISPSACCHTDCRFLRVC